MWDDIKTLVWLVLLAVAFPVAMVPLLAWFFFVVDTAHQMGLI